MEIPRAAGPGDAALDEQARAILERAAMDVPAALASGHPVFQAAAARLVGAEGDRGRLDQLAALAEDPAAVETARVEAAYALGRLGDERGGERLVELLAVPTTVSPAALQAAGRLARLGDRRGEALIAQALRSPERYDALVAAKELDAFGSKELFDLALAHPDASVQGEARAARDKTGSSG